MRRVLAAPPRPSACVAPRASGSSVAPWAGWEHWERREPGASALALQQAVERAEALQARRAASKRKQKAKRRSGGRAPVERTSLFLVGLDQLPVRVARRRVTAEGPQVARLHGIAHRSGDHLPIRIARDGGNVGFEANGQDGHALLDRRLCYQHLVDRHEPIVELKPVLLALLHCAGERLIDMIVDMAADGVEIALPEGF